jgi:hypothetical protein
MSFPSHHICTGGNKGSYSYWWEFYAVNISHTFPCLRRCTHDLLNSGYMGYNCINYYVIFLSPKTYFITQLKTQNRKKNPLTRWHLDCSFWGVTFTR